MTGLSFGDCVKDENALPVHPGKVTSYCKASSVIGIYTAKIPRISFIHVLVCFEKVF